MNVKTQIKNYKNRLVRKAKRAGLWENFGQEEVNVLRSQYLDHQYKNDGVWQQIMMFDDWCMNFDTKELRKI